MGDNKIAAWDGVDRREPGERRLSERRKVEEVSIDIAGQTYKLSDLKPLTLGDKRKLFKHQDLPDWTGRSPEYRAAIDEVYHRAKVPSDSEADIQSKVRYHLGNVMREVAPAGDLEALGLQASPPSVRNSAGTKNGGRIRAEAVTDAGLLIDHALADVRLLRALEGIDKHAVVTRLRGLVDEVFAVIGDFTPPA